MYEDTIEIYSDLLAHCLVVLKHAKERGLFEDDDLIDCEVDTIFKNYSKTNPEGTGMDEEPIFAKGVK